MKIFSNKAFTLVEVLVTVLISTMILAGLYSTFIVGNQSMQRFLTNTSVKQQMRNAFIRLGQELREAKNITIEKSASGTKINFLRPGQGIVTYQWWKVGEKANHLLRITPDGEQILANNIITLAFNYPKDDAITFEMQAARLPVNEKSRVYRLKEKIALRYKMINSEVQ